MKNIHVIPVDKEPVKGDLLLRHIWKGEPNECISWWRYNDTTMYGDTLVYTTLNGSFMDVPSSFKVQNIYITSDEEIKIGNWVLDIEENTIFKPSTYEIYHIKNSEAKYYEYCKKIILTTDQDLIKDGLQAIDDEFLEWFVKNPSCESVDVEGHIYKGQDETEYKIIIPKEEAKQGTFITAVDGDGEWLSPVATERAWQEKKLVEIFGHYPTASPKWQYMNGLIQNSLEAKQMYSKKEVMDMFDTFSMYLPLHYKFLLEEELKKE
jgi:hypothetical protein